jgi:NAD(P)H-dependent flavin oxidoreductase YrpB (nitropropane dioxygenase family)
MGTRFLLTEESPVPAATKQHYLASKPEEIVISAALDGLPQRMLLNTQLKHLMSATSAGLFTRAVRSAFALSRQTGDSPWALLKAGWRMYRAGDDSLASTMMAANAPVLIQEAVVHGRPESGILPSGQVAGLIDNLPLVADMIEELMQEADSVVRNLTTIRDGGVQVSDAPPRI